MAKHADQPISPGVIPSAGGGNDGHVASMKAMFRGLTFDGARRRYHIAPDDEGEILRVARTYDGGLCPHLRLTLAHRAYWELANL